MKHEKIIRLVTSAMMIALSTVLSMVTIFKMPLGGSITPLSMLPICLVSIKYGVSWGIGTSFAYSLLQLFLDLGAALSWGLSREAVLACIFVDYLLAFTVLGLAGIFRHKGTVGMLGGIALAIFLRFLCHVISGGTVFAIWSGWSNVWLYSLCYNGAFMLPECILTMLGTYALMRVPSAKRMIAR